MLFSAIYFSVRERDFGVYFLAQTRSNDPTMEVALVKHDLRNISASVEDGIGADRPELQ